MECYCNLQNIQDILADGKTPHERRFGEPFKGPIIPFGALVENKSISTRDQTRLHQFGKKVLPGIFQGYALIAGGLWKGDILIADMENGNYGRIRNLLSTNQRRRNIDRTKRRRIHIRRWHSKIVRKRLRIPRTRSKTKQAVRRENLRGKFQDEPEESQPTEPTDDAEARADFWSIQDDFIYRHHNEPRVQLYLPKEETFPIPLKYTGVTRSTHTDLDVIQEKRIDEKVSHILHY